MSAALRRDCLRAFGAWAAASPFASAQKLLGEPEGRIAPADELVNVFEMEQMAERKLSPELFQLVRGSDRAALDRITLRPRLMVNTMGLDLSVDLLGEKLFAPILIGPAPQLGRFHREGELGMARGAAAGKALYLAAANSSRSLDDLPGSRWLQVDPDADPGTAKTAPAVCLTLSGGTPWSVVDKWRKAVSGKLLVKGVMQPGDALEALRRGADALVVSPWRAGGLAGAASAIEALPAIAAAVAGKAPVLADGSFRRGSDVLKALALGARAVLITRPALWGLAAYGDRGVQTVVEMLQTELARDMAMCGKPNVAALDKSAVRIHRW
jgi:isopentenyl diphosphate isomerase/L-lactate dehydrogenase-like FMN-dependent dehydrogenase